MRQMPPAPCHGEGWGAEGRGERGRRSRGGSLQVQWNPEDGQIASDGKNTGLFIDGIDPVTIQHPPLSLFISCLVSGTYLSSLSSCVVCLHAKCHFL